MAGSDFGDGLVRAGEENLPRGVRLGKQRDQLLITRGWGNIENLRARNDQAWLMSAPDLGGRQRQQQIFA
jgi:hypothetical protein